MNSRLLTVKPVILAAFALVISSTSYAQAPLPFPAVSGPFKVGNADVEMTDPGRLETFTEAPDDKRRLLVSLYYPADVPANAVRAPYASAALGAALRVPAEALNQTSAGYIDVPVAEGSFPVLIFSPGAGNITHYYSSLLNEVASQGYVVAAIWHTYTTRTTLFPDGSIVKSNAAGTVTGESLEEQMASLEAIGNVWVDDQRFVLAELARRNTADALLAGHLDLEKVGAFGHSLGGAVALETAYKDDRFDAALNMDGTMFSSAASAVSRVPFLFLRSAPTLTDDQLKAAELSREEYDSDRALKLDTINQVINSSDVASLIEFEGARHSAFVTDNLFFSPIIPAEQRLSMIGTVDPVTGFKKVATWVVDFMDKYVK
jgi:dienelactone hydrolase